MDNFIVKDFVVGPHYVEQFWNYVNSCFQLDSFVGLLFMFLYGRGMSQYAWSYVKGMGLVLLCSEFSAIL